MVVYLIYPVGIDQRIDFWMKNYRDNLLFAGLLVKFMLIMRETS